MNNKYLQVYSFFYCFNIEHGLNFQGQDYWGGNLDDIGKFALEKYYTYF